MKKVISYLLAVLMTAWTGALTIVTGLFMLDWTIAAVSRAAAGDTFRGVVLIVALVFATAGASALVKERMREWGKDKE